MERRVVRSRSNRAIQAAAAALARTPVTPNQISSASILAALLVPLGLGLYPGRLGVGLALLGIQGRLLANVLDGLVAVEGGKHSVLGALYNEIPDRVTDTIILVSLGYAGRCLELGWLAALLAALTAYIRVFGGALGLTQQFLGPMAKQHRMAVASAALLILLGWPAAQAAVLRIALASISVGSAYTCWRRLRVMAHSLHVREDTRP